jgi:FAD dependent oxidoreductase
MNHYDYIVLGAGIIFKHFLGGPFLISLLLPKISGVEGSWTAYQLIKDKSKPKVLLLERFPLPHSRGSSHGQTRIIRHAYAEDFHAALMPKAFQEWRQLETDANTRLFV